MKSEGRQGMLLCLRCSEVHNNGGETEGLRCMIRGDWTKRFLVCDDFDPPPYGVPKP